ncbi:aminoglycoside phosphotransferase family protein [Frankia sp. CNm7]|uniref:Aminoglycoside phosphotransferase family protein n=1 Tax=Frankia nepalensis TaxID=1836974 RepID=A0A937RAX2_9ACTN|nr:aminoglycoside phosphotransferase family protein [Frankia nepalensis]MBL7496153.1 aminoglycoside phosphotransferase family protein [Frankia nepalensis]MBL7508908.1 aminoglycoside phosphotransferase family protein [Frankia nepalensis]MBL7516748.1 aminoglycoside phosphotransferase family protein [Frankia nepalensis]MBL7628686.1 aminoglycoside phosphotransferase family protein [Frankia nepalensis]
MRLRQVERSSGAFQQPLTAGEIRAICGRVFGSEVRVVTAEELGAGLYNTTYRVTVAGRDRPVILRVAPEPGRQFASEWQLMRNEYASLPYLAMIAPLLPKVIAADWSQELIGRDWMVQTLLDGVPAPSRLGDYPRALWPVFFRELGAIARRVHGVRGTRFGPVTGPGYGSWSEAVIASLEAVVTDLDGAGLDAADLRRVIAVAVDRRAVLDEVTEPRLLAGDLWTVNVMLHETTPEPTITGVFDLDRTWFGDSAADWTIRMALTKQDERVAFWDGYGPRDTSPAARLRQQIYEGRHLGAVRLERHRLGNADGVRASYPALSAVLAHLT